MENLWSQKAIIYLIVEKVIKNVVLHTANNLLQEKGSSISSFQQKHLSKLQFQ